MPNLKLDLVNDVLNDKMYAETELVRLAQNPNMNYKEKVLGMKDQLQLIAFANAELGLIEQYLPEQQTVASQVPPSQTAPEGPPVRTIAGQSHGE